MKIHLREALKNVRDRIGEDHIRINSVKPL